MKSGKISAPGGAVKKPKKTISLSKFVFTLAKFLVIFIITLAFAVGGISNGAIYAYIETAGFHHR